MDGINPHSVRFERSRETAHAQPQPTRFSTSLETNGAGETPNKPPRAELAAAAKAFEAVFVRQMIGSMRAAKLAEDDLLGGGQAAEQFRDLQDGKLADAMSGSFGIAEMLEKQFGALSK